MDVGTSHAERKQYTLTNFLFLFDVQKFFGDDLAGAAIIILNLIMIESMLSIDNALVMATMVMDLPKQQRGKALRYGIFGAYFFRGICLILASYLLQVSWLKLFGGLYLLYLTYDHFRSRKKESDAPVEKHRNWLYKNTVGKVGVFWSTVILVNVMDLAFSIDNVFAAVAYTNNIYLICTGVFIGILAIRFVAQGVLKLLEVFTFLTTSAFVIIGVLGIKLILSFLCSFIHSGTICTIMEGDHAERADMIFSLITVVIFLAPVLTSLLFNFPKRHKPTKQIEELEKAKEKADGDLPL